MFSFFVFLLNHYFYCLTSSFFLLICGIVDMDVNDESSINTTHLNIHTVVAKEDDYYFCFSIQNIDDIPDYNKVYLTILILYLHFNNLLCRTQPIHIKIILIFFVF